MDIMKIGVIGCGGFAQMHHRVIRDLEAEGGCRLVWTCDPDAAVRDAAAAKFGFAERGVAVGTDYREMLERFAPAGLDIVTIPTPVPLHAAMHRACVERGVAAYLEKPPTLDLAELREMLVVEAGARKATQVGFNFIGQAARRRLKERLLAGEFGRLRRVTFRGIWPRSTAYFLRSNWAGRREMNGRLVLDSCLTNAMAHFVHNLLFWCGTDGLDSWARAGKIRCRMERAHDIETADTVFLLAESAAGVEIRIAMTHAVAGEQEDEEQVECDRAVITYRETAPPGVAHRFTVAPADGGPVEDLPTEADIFLENLRHYVEYVRGGQPRPRTLLADCAPFVEFCNAAFAAAGPATVIPRMSQLISPIPDGTPGELREIPGIRDACRRLVETGRFPAR